MARRKPHEDHINHEAWAIPYGDLITLLLAFFVVMYAVSSVNQGKYRVLSDSLNAAFRGAPSSLEPIQVGQKQKGGGADIKISIVQQAMTSGQPREQLRDIKLQPQASGQDSATDSTGTSISDQEAAALKDSPAPLDTMQTMVEQAMAPLIMQDLVTVRRTGRALEVEIRTDILFGSGSATLAPPATDAIRQLAGVLRNYTNPVRVEGHTDNIPIRSSAFPSNWELSSARAASVVHLLANEGVNPSLLAVLGFGEFRPVQANDTIEGRNANRRVLIVILGADAAVSAPVVPVPSTTAPRPAARVP